MQQPSQDNSQYFTEINLNVLPVSDSTIFLENSIYMDDNLDRIIKIEEQFHKPIKMMFTTMVFCAEGELKAKINDTLFTLTKGCILVSMPGDILESMESSEGTKLIIGAYHIKQQKAQDVIFSKSIRTVGKNIYNGSSPISLSLDEVYSAMFINLYKVEKDIIRHTTEELLGEALTNYFSTINCMLASFSQSTKSENAPLKRNRESLIFSDFIDNIHTYASTERSITFYADKACLSPKYFSRIVTKTSGQKPGHWIKKYVVLEAKAMLGTGQYTIQQVSDRLNFPNPSFFCKYFRSVEGRSPGDYMKEKTEQ